MTCRDINELHPTAQTACRLFLSECDSAGVKVFITETYRSQARQNYLYEQGRSRAGKVVTWTKNSNHSGRLAWDIAVSPPANLYDVSTLQKAGAIARNLGITWGGDWPKNIDRPHFEVKTSWKAPARSVAMDVAKAEGGARMFKPTSATLNDAYAKFLQDAIKGGHLNAKWLAEFKAGKLSLDDALALYVIESQRHKA